MYTNPGVNQPGTKKLGARNVGAQNPGAHNLGRRETNDLLLERRSQHNPGSTPPQVVLHSLPFNVDVVLLNRLLLMLHMLAAKPAKLIVEEVVLHGLLMVLHMLAANASSQGWHQLALTQRQNSSKRIGSCHVWHTLEFLPSQDWVH